MIHFIILFLICFLPCAALGAGEVNDTPKVYDVVIVGGGIAGLTAAYNLDDYDVLLLEMKKEVGGRASTGQYRTVSFARGAEYLGKPEDALAEMIDELGLTLREIPAPADIVFRGGKFYVGELGKARLLVEKSNIGEFNRFARRLQEMYDTYDEIPDISLKGELARMDNITAKQWFDENHFPQIYHEVYNVTARGLFGAALDEISALAVLPEFAFDFDGFEGVEDEDELALELSETDGSTGMYTFDKGIGAIPVALSQDLGDSIRTNTRVTAIARVGELFEVSCIENGNKELSYRAEAVIIATSAAVALDIGDGALSGRQRQLLSSVEYAPYATIALFSDSPIFDKGFDLAIEDGNILTDIYYASWVADHYLPRKGENRDAWGSVICAAPKSYRDHSLLELSDKELLSEVLIAIDKVLPGSSAHVVGHEITRFRHGFPVMTPGSYQRMVELDKVDGQGLILAGDYLIYPTFEAAASSGYLAAEKAIEWLSD